MIVLGLNILVFVRRTLRRATDCPAFCTVARAGGCIETGIRRTLAFDNND